MSPALKQLQDTHEELKQRLKIDRNQLETELEQQAEAFYEVCEAHARAVSLRDEFKTATEEQYAISATKIREDFESEKERHTEAQIKEAVAMDKDYLDSCATYLEAKKLADLLAGLRDAYDQRGKMMKELAQLFIAGYFSTVRIESGGSVVREANAGQAREAMAASRAASKETKAPVSSTKAIKKFGKRE